MNNSEHTPQANGPNENTHGDTPSPSSHVVAIEWTPINQTSFSVSAPNVDDCSKLRIHPLRAASGDLTPPMLGAQRALELAVCQVLMIPALPLLEDDIECIFDFPVADTMPVLWTTALRYYVTHARRPDDLLHAVLCNDLNRAVRLASALDLLRLPDLLQYIAAHMPSKIYGDCERVRAWLIEGDVTLYRKHTQL